MYQRLLRPIFFLFDPEKIHHVSFRLIRWVHAIGLGPVIRRYYHLNHPGLKREVFGLTFPNPVGLAAGFDKDALAYRELANFGFGFIEIGTVTPKPQEGNPKKRLFRLTDDQGVINRMGFNNKGVDHAVSKLRRNKGRVLIGGNIGKNKVTPNDQAVSDYCSCFEALFELVDYFVVNVSSPNTPNLRDLQEKEPLTKLLRILQERNLAHDMPKPILLKIAPDLTDGQLQDIIDIVQETKIAGVIATNTTLSREGLKHPNKIETGGLSGKPLTKRATKVIRFLHQKSGGAFPIIGVGGIHSAEDALEKIEAGASLVQLYTGFIYQGPGLIKKINQAILNRG
jgi:dihydroorotate dehydrogenase